MGGLAKQIAPARTLLDRLDDVLASVGKIKDLKVIARSSVMDYSGARLAGKVRAIGRTLRVSHVLEGGVRRSVDHVVVNVALIDTRDERQVWSEHYERTLTDTLSLQGELAIEIARALHFTLTPAEATLAATKPTQTPRHTCFTSAPARSTSRPGFPRGKKPQSSSTNKPSP